MYNISNELATPSKIYNDVRQSKTKFIIIRIIIHFFRREALKRNNSNNVSNCTKKTLMITKRTYEEETEEKGRKGKKSEERCGC